MPTSARRVAALSTAIGLPVLAVIVSLAIISSPGPPQLDTQDPVRIAVPDRGPDGLTEARTGNEQGIEPGQPPVAEQPIETGPLLVPDFRADPPRPQQPNPPAQTTRRPQQRPPAPAPPATDYDNDDDPDDEDDDDDDD